MILVRSIFQAKFGRAGELAKLMKEGTAQMTQAYGGKARVLTDLSGQFDTVAIEVEAPSLAEWERTRAEMFSSPDLGETFAPTAALIEGGRSEFYTIE